MRRILLLALVSVALVFSSEDVCARSWRINPSTEAKADFTSLSDALKSLEVFNGDTLYLDAGCFVSGCSINKSVTIIGTGFNLAGSPVKEAVIGSTLWIETSDVKVEGCIINGGVSPEDEAKNVTFERCRILGSVNSLRTATVKGPIKIFSCFIGGGISQYNTGSNFVISNNIIRGQLSNLNSATITNNVIVYDGDDSKTDYALVDIKNSNISNNIIINTNTKYAVNTDQTVFYYKNNTIKDTTPEYNNSIVRNVLSTAAEYAFPNYPDNKFIGVALEDVFVMEGGIDAMYELKEGSPALGYGTNGYDCGIFSGPYPFVLSGRPRLVPYIYEATIPNQSTDGKLNITLKIKSQNE